MKTNESDIFPPGEPPAAAQPAKWRVGNKVPINVYHGDRPVCQCQTAIDAELIVEAVNGVLHPPASAVQPDELRDLCECEHERHMHGEPTSGGWADDCRFCTCNAFTLAKLPASAVSPTLTQEEIIIVREGLRALDCGQLHCRYCDACSPEWNHSRSCPYADSVRVVEQARAILDRLQSAVVSPREEPKKPLNYPSMKYTVAAEPMCNESETCAVCGARFFVGSQVYRDPSSPDAFRCLSHGPASVPLSPKGQEKKWEE